MNKVILLGRLTKDPEVRYSTGSEPIAVARYALAVNRRFKRPNEADADFINCVAFGKQGEFAEKFLKKGQMISVVGRIQNRSWDDAEGKKRYATDIVVEEHFFAESKSSFEANKNSVPQQQPKQEKSDGFYPVDESIEDDDLPF